MAEKLSVAETHAELERLLASFTTFCQLHNLTYYLSYGSLLGAVREGKLIPWDDDIDVQMPREDYEKFKRLYPRHPAPDTLLMLPGDKDYPTPFAALVSTRTTFESDVYTFPKEFGLHIDVFPLDSARGWTAPLRFYTMHQLLNLCFASHPHEKNRIGDKTKPPWLAEPLSLRTLKRPHKLLPSLFARMAEELAPIGRHIPRSRFMAWANTLASGTRKARKGDMADWFAYKSFPRATIPEHHLREPETVTLGELTVATFSDPETLLEKWYGPDWRIPDPDWQPSHGAAFWREGAGDREGTSS